MIFDGDFGIILFFVDIFLFYCYMLDKVFQVFDLVWFEFFVDYVGYMG